MIFKEIETVLLLGAGFSVPAGLPPQDYLLSDALGADLESRPISRHKIQFDDNRAQIQLFLETVFGDINAVSLEDVYTFLDELMNEADLIPPQYIGGYRDSLRRSPFFPLQSPPENELPAISATKLKQCLNRTVLHYLLTLEIESKLDLYLDLVDVMDQRYGENSWCSISLNWDTIWDNAIRCSKGPADYFSGGVMLHDDGPSRITNTSSTLSSVLIKLHGSINWLECSRCNTVFHLSSELSGEHIGRLVYGEQECPFCVQSRLVSSQDLRKNELRLQPMFVTPTFRKRLENPHLQLLWNRALHILGQASEVIIVGYSLPLSDYLIRTLLKRGICKKSEIQVILADGDKLPDDMEDISLRKSYAGPRHIDFFGLPEESVHYCGFESYFGL